MPARPSESVDGMLERFRLGEYRDKPAGVLPEGVRKLARYRHGDGGKADDSAAR